MQGVAVIGGAMLGYLALLDLVGLWFHDPWQRFPAMALFALLTWAAYLGVARDPHISRPTQRALWWGLWGFIGGYLLQVVYLWNRAGVLRAGSLGTKLWEPFFKALETEDRQTIARMSLSWWTSETRWAGLLLLGVLILGLIALARAGAWHLDATQRRPQDPDRGPLQIGFLQQQRWLLIWGLGLLTLIALMIGTDPRSLDFAEGLALSWAQQHGAIFGFLAGYIVETRRRGHPQDTLPGRKQGSKLGISQTNPHSVRLPGLPGRTALV